MGQVRIEKFSLQALEALSQCFCVRFACCCPSPAQVPSPTFRVDLLLRVVNIFLTIVVLFLSAKLSQARTHQTRPHHLLLFQFDFATKVLRVPLFCLLFLVFVYLSICLSACLFVCLSISLPVCCRYFVCLFGWLRSKVVWLLRAC